MKDFFKNDVVKVVVVLVLQLFLFSSGFKTYFHQDDFIDMSLSQNLGQVVNAFNIFRPSPEFAFYRPIPVQTYYFLLNYLFGWNVLGYHVVTMLVLFTASTVVYIFAKQIFKDTNMAFWTMFFFALNPTHFAAANSAAYAHETILVIFSVVSVYLLDRFVETGTKKFFFWGLLVFLAALCTKETAVVIPGLLALISFLRSKKLLSRRLVFTVFTMAAILGVYLFGHLKFYGMPENSSYKIILGKATVNISAWYLIWALGAPNFLIDLVGSKFKLAYNFWDILGLNAVTFFDAFTGLVLFTVGGMYFMVRNGLKKLFPAVIFFAWFLVAIIPVAIFPLHKLAIEQTLGLVGISLFFGWLLGNLKSEAPVIMLLIPMCFLINSVNTVVLARSNHWIPRSALNAKSTVNLINRLAPSIPDNSKIYFTDGLIKVDAWGSSRQVYYATGNGVGLALMFKDKGWKFYFEDTDKGKISSSSAFVVNSDEVFSN